MMEDVEVFCPRDRYEWRKWLALNHKRKKAVWVIFYKKKSPDYNLSWSESVDEAICFGWIDSVKKSIDKDRYKQYFSKRKAKSVWSIINKEKVRTLIEQGLMEEEGYKSIELAKENGSWTILNEVDLLIIPEDLKKEFIKHKKSNEYFDSLKTSEKKALLFWIVSAKRTDTRQNRISEIAENAGKRRKPKQFR